MTLQKLLGMEKSYVIILYLFLKACLLRDMGIERLSIFHCFERVVGFHKIGKHGVTEQDV